MIALFVALVPALFAALPLFGMRYIPTHDGEYHLVRFWQFYTMLSSGNAFPRWAPDLNYGFGIPLFTFQYPFPNYVGSFFHMFGLSFVDSVKWTLASGYIAALVFCFFYLRLLFGKYPAIIGTIAAAFVPYWFVDIYIRGSVGEVWGIAFVFGALWAISSRNMLMTTVMILLLILSHNIMALLFFPVLLGYTLLFHRSVIYSVLLGVGGASYFWIPALYEQQFIRGLSPVNIFDYFPQIYQLLIPSWGSGFRGQISGATEMSYQIGVIPLFILLCMIFVLFRKGRLPKEACFFVAINVLAILMMIPWSEFLWRLMPFFYVIQYPWRLLSVIIISVPLFTAYLASTYRISWVLAVLSFIVTFSYFHPVTYEPRTDEHYLTQRSFTAGTSSLGNAFQTKWVQGDLSEVREELFMPSGTVRVETVSPTRFRMSVVASESGILTVPIAFYPGWKGSIDGNEVIVSPDRQGLSSLRIPSGSHAIRFWLGSTLWQFGAASLSILSLSVALVSFILKRKYDREVVPTRGTT